MMRISDKQKRALEKITGKDWNAWHPDAVRAYFLLTDKGQATTVIPEARSDFTELMSQHHWHSVIVEMWKEDFRKGLLFLDDFLRDGYPDAYVKHAFEIYQETMGYVPSKYHSFYSSLS